MSEALFLVNPKRKRRKKNPRKGRMPAGLRRYWATHRRKKNPGRKRRSRRKSMTISMNPKRRRRRNPAKSYRRHHRRRNPMRAHRRHHRRSNPFSMRGISAGAIVVAVLACQAAVPAAPPFASCATAQVMPTTIIAKPRILLGAESFCQLIMAHLTSAEFPSGNRLLPWNALGKVFGPPPF